MRRHLLISIVITSIFVSSLGFLSLLMTRQFRKESTPPFSPPAVLFAKFLYSVPKDQRVDALEKIADDETRAHFQFWLVDVNGQIIYPREATPLPIEWSQMTKPQGLFEFDEIIDGNPSFVIVRVDKSPMYFLVKSKRHPPGNRMFFVNSLALVIAVILGTTLSFFILFYSLRQKAVLADSIISELQKGNLKARFPITKMDEVGRAMLRFNNMAEEIERLVERLKATESSRMVILQELAHDLRTPVASLKTMLETLSNKSESMELDLKNELTSLSLKEVDYFEHLVEDLLFLAQATEPRYNLEAKPVSIVGILDEEVESAENAKIEENKNVMISKIVDPEIKEIYGDQHLLRRLIRNAIDNAMSFAKSSVKLAVKNLNDTHVELTILDDGPGFSTESLKEFGQRKFSRTYISSNQRRASIGLGSVIMSTVVTLHRGQIMAQNRTDNGGKILGGQVKIILPV